MEHCEICGFVWELVASAEQASRLAEIGSAYRRVLLPPDRPAGWAERASTRPSPEVWSAVEYACHVRDVILTCRERILLALVQDTPVYAPMFADERVLDAAYASEDLGDVVAEIEVASALLARPVARLSKDQFARTGVYGYPQSAERSMAWVGAQVIHEAEHHLVDISAQLAPFAGGLELVRRAPKDCGRVDLVVRRPDVDGREILDVAHLTVAEGIEGDNWTARGSRRTTDGSSLVDAQLNLMSSRAIRLISGGDDHERWALAGDQLFVDLDLSESSLPPGTRLAMGTAVIEVTPEPHRGCAKFTKRFGLDALRAVNSGEGRALRLRGLCAKVVTEGEVRPGDEIRVIR